MSKIMELIKKAIALIPKAMAIIPIVIKAVKKICGIVKNEPVAAKKKLGKKGKKKSG